jgi:hypothetical protein
MLQAALADGYVLGREPGRRGRGLAGDRMYYSAERQSDVWVMELERS